MLVTMRSCRIEPFGWVMVRDVYPLPEPLKSVWVVPEATKSSLAEVVVTGPLLAV